MEAVIIFYGAVFSCLFLGIIVAQLLHHLHVPGFIQENDAGNILLATLSLHGMALVLVAAFLKWHGVSWSEALGLKNRRLVVIVSLAAAVAIVMLPIALMLENLGANLMEQFGFHPETQKAVDMMLQAKSPAAKVYMGFFAVVLAPVAEEFLFRGILYPFIKQLGYKKTALFSVNLLFAAIHFDTIIFVPLFLLALALTWLYEVTDSLLTPILAHSAFNAMNLVILFLMEKFGSDLPAQ